MSEQRLTAGQVRFRVGTGAAASVGAGGRLAFADADTPGHGLWFWLVLAGVVVVGWLWFSSPSRSGRMGYNPWEGATDGWGAAGSGGQVRRWSARSRQSHGMASAWSVWRKASWWAMRSRAKGLRPSLRGRFWFRARQVAQPLARVGLLKVYSPCEDVTIRFGGPRVGKSGELAGRILDAPGAVIATSTRTDLYGLCGGLRAKRGPVRVFNPGGMAGAPCSVAFDPLIGCEDPTTAGLRAGDLLAGANLGGGSGDREFWLAQARRALAAVMHAAALGGASMRDVAGWVANPTGAEREVLGLLEASPAPSMITDAAQFLSTNPNTRTSITTTIMPALGWLSDPGAWAATQPTADGSRVLLDVAEVIAATGTVFLIGAEEAHTAPLVTALTGHIAREARRLSAEAGGRLDPALELVLDEAALICRVPLDQWTADMGGRGIAMHICAQSFSQLEGRFGREQAAATLSNAATVMVFGRTRAISDLNMYSQLTGTRIERRQHYGHDGRISTSQHDVPVMTPAQISQLPPGRVLIIKGDLRPMIGRVQMAWKRADVRAYRMGLRLAAASVFCHELAVETRMTAIVWTAQLRLWVDRAVVPVLVAAGQAVERWADRVTEPAEARAARRLVEAAQRRARKRGL